MDFDSPAAKQFGIDAIPYFRIYDGKGALVSEGETAYGWFWSEIHKHQ